MKVIIQIPCHNEAATLPAVIRDLPRTAKGITAIESLVIDDGSTDGTAERARELGVHHIVRLGTRHGLAQAFLRGLRYATDMGADIVVNTDGDNQYCGEDVVRLIDPILENRADMVVGTRPIPSHPEFSPTKKFMQLLGSWVVRRLSGVAVDDATSGFRAFSRRACFRLILYTSFSHCIESLIQAGHLGLRVACVPVRVNPRTRESRLFRSLPHYIYRQGVTLLSMLVLYRPGAFFFTLGALALFFAVAIGLRFLYLVYGAPVHISLGRTHLPSLILLAIAATGGFLCWALGLIGEWIRFHRRVAEETLELLREERAERRDTRRAERV